MPNLAKSWSMVLGETDRPAELRAEKVGWFWFKNEI